MLSAVGIGEQPRCCAVRWQVLSEWWDHGGLQVLKGELTEQQGWFKGLVLLVFAGMSSAELP